MGTRLLNLALALVFAFSGLTVLAPAPDDLWPPAPADNATTPEKVALGRKLFFDRRLSGDNTMSCATCHQPEKAFTDGLPRSRGAGGRDLPRNAPTLLNAGFYSSYLWDGRAASLEEQARIPITSPEEMNQVLDALVKELKDAAEYEAQFRAAFGSGVTAGNLLKALAAFQRTLVTRDSPFDRYLAGDKTALSDEAVRGWQLFRGEAGCIRCHSGPNFTDGKFYRIGTSFTDRGRGAVTGMRSELYAFRTPGLRDVARTAPYMHDGSMATLTEVVEFYYRRVPSQGPEGLPLDVEVLAGQSVSDVTAIVAFLESLTGRPPTATRR